MTKEQLEKAKELEQDIKMIQDVLEDSKMRKWIKVIGARHEHKEDWYSVRFQHELAKWLEEKKQEYEKELEEM